MRRRQSGRATATTTTRRRRACASGCCFLRCCWSWRRCDQPRRPMPRGPCCHRLRRPRPRRRRRAEASAAALAAAACRRRPVRRWRPPLEVASSAGCGERGAAGGRAAGGRRLDACPWSSLLTPRAPPTPTTPALRRAWFAAAVLVPCGWVPGSDDDGRARLPGRASAVRRAGLADALRGGFVQATQVQVELSSLLPPTQVKRAPERSSQSRH